MQIMNLHHDHTDEYSKILADNQERANRSFHTTDRIINGARLVKGAMVLGVAALVTLSLFNVGSDKEATRFASAVRVEGQPSSGTLNVLLAHCSKLIPVTVEDGDKGYMSLVKNKLSATDNNAPALAAIVQAVDPTLGLAVGETFNAPTGCSFRTINVSLGGLMQRANDDARRDGVSEIQGYGVTVSFDLPDYGPQRAIHDAVLADVTQP